MKNIAVIFAGGVGSRMKNPTLPKQFLEINDIPIIVHTINNFQFNNNIDDIIVVMLEEYIPFMHELKNKYNLSKVTNIVKGGVTGQESIYNGLKAAKNICKDDNAIVLIHDGVRPIMEEDLIDRNIDAVRQYGSAISCVPSKETIIGIDSNNNINNIVDRKFVWIARAPQSFYLNDILDVHLQAINNNETNIIDSCTLMTKYGKNLHTVETCQENIKITTPEDYYVVQGLINAKSDLKKIGYVYGKCFTK